MSTAALAAATPADRNRLELLCYPGTPSLADTSASPRDCAQKFSAQWTGSARTAEAPLSEPGTHDRRIPLADLLRVSQQSGMRVPSLGQQEHEVLRCVWELRRCTARQVHDLVGAPRKLAYTTVATVLDRLCAKGLLSRERVGRGYEYKPAARPQAVEQARARDLVAKVLGTRPEPAIASIVDAVEAIDPELLDRLAEEVARRRGRRGS